MTPAARSASQKSRNSREVMRRHPKRLRPDELADRVVAEEDLVRRELHRIEHVLERPHVGLRPPDLSGVEDSLEVRAEVGRSDLGGDCVSPVGQNGSADAVRLQVIDKAKHFLIDMEGLTPPSIGSLSVAKLHSDPLNPLAARDAPGRHLFEMMWSEYDGPNGSWFEVEEHGTYGRHRITIAVG